MAIFINYRRDDSKAITGRIDDHLRMAFGDADVYRDVDSIPPGVDFVSILRLRFQLARGSGLPLPDQTQTEPGIAR